MSSSSVYDGPAPSLRTGFQGPRIVYLAILGFGAMCALGLFAAGAGEEGVRVAIRATARTTPIAAVMSVVLLVSLVLRVWPKREKRTAVN